MITLNEINKMAKQYGVPSETIEKDYIISWILFCLAKSPLKEDFIFYGGTAIKRMYFEDHRFSEDIDLISHKKFSYEYLIDKLNVLRIAHEKTGIELSINDQRSIISKDRLQMLIEYSAFDEIVGAPKEIRLDFSMSSSLYGQTISKSIIKSYSDFTEKSTLKVPTLNSILANKLGLLIDNTRNEPRDIFDIWFLFSKMNIFDFDFHKVCDFFKDTYGFAPSLSLLEKWMVRKPYNKTWKIRLEKQLRELPDYDLVKEDICEKLKGLFKSCSSEN